jgi:chromosome segregation protein
VARFESELKHAEETRSRLESQHTERRGQLVSWREQRAQLTQSLHSWAVRAAEAKQRVAESRKNLELENNSLPQAEQAFRGAQERLDTARNALSQAESRLQLEQANFAHLERGKQALEQRRERLEAELQTLAEPDAAALRQRESGVAGLRVELESIEGQFERLQADYAAAEERRAAAAEARGTAQREHAAAQAQLDTLRQIQAAAEDNAPLREWLERHGLAHAARLWQKLRIEQGWETAVESVLRERLHALELTDPSRLEAALGDRPPVKASIFDHGSRGSAPPAAGLPLAAKIHASDPAVAGALADWLAGAVAVEGTPEPGLREALPAGTVMVNRDGHQFTRHTVSFHAPDPEDAGLLARQAEIEELEKRCADLAARVATAEAEEQDH